jgi:D-serine deaminase-like pyridoxal phosphate-dependent protein
MQRPIFKPVGTHVEDLDTPALVVDLDALGRNIEAMHSSFRDGPLKLRPSVESHRCPAIAHMQLAAGGTVGGVSTSTVGQAEVFVAAGITDLLVASMVVTPPKIERLCALARRARVSVAADNAGNVRALSEAASAAGVTLNVLVAIDPGHGWSGVQPDEDAVALASQVAHASGLHLAGIMAHDAPETPMAVQRLLEARRELERNGLKVETVSAASTAMDGVTEVRAGSYALSDLRHLDRFEPAARVLGSVTSLPEPGVIITDTGRKAIGNDTGEPSVDNVPGAKLRSLSAEHGLIDVDGPVETVLGAPVWYTPWDIGACVNLYDYMYGVRNDRLEAVLEVQARGRYR